MPGRPTNWIKVGQGLTALAVDAGGVCLDIFCLVCYFSSLSFPVWETVLYRLKYCLKGPLIPEQVTNQLGQAQFANRWISRSSFIGALELTFKAPITTAADDIHKYFFIVPQRK